MSFIHDLNQKVILFVGRPSDSRKGLSLFLEAVTILTTLSGLPAFAIWIVGGSPREVRYISCLIDRISSLHDLRLKGRIQLWGRVENAALAEIYSRASVTVVPSHREEFGIVAVEAMMCGCPVVATKTGGLEDIIIDGQTGTLFEPDYALGLAATLTAYLRNPYQREIHGKAARARAKNLFSRSETLARVAQLYDMNAAGWNQSFDQLKSNRNQFLTHERLSRIKAIVGDDQVSVSPAAKGRHPVFCVEAGDSRFIAKFFTPRFSLQASLFPNASPLSAKRGGLISYHRELYNRENPLAPAIRFLEDAAEPLIVTDWIKPFTDVSDESLDDVVSQAFLQCESHLPLPDCAELTEYEDALKRVAERPDSLHFHQFDCASAKLNARMTAHHLTQCRTHPQIELLRFQILMSEDTWPLPLEFRGRTSQAIGLLLGKHQIISERPTLAHGDPKPEHLLADSVGKILIADFEHSRYTVGPCDLALWFSFTGVRGLLEANASHICDRICKQCSTWQERYLCACWVVSEVLFFAVHRFTCGDRRELQVTQNFLRDLPMALLRNEIIR